MDGEPFVVDLAETTLGDLARVGGKNAALGEMIGMLQGKGIRVPGGFAVTVAAWKRFLEAGRLEPALREILQELDTRDVDDLARAGHRARQAILGVPLPEEVASSILEAFRRLGADSVAVRSSATAEDLPESSFAGQHESFLNVRGESGVLRAVHECYASLFTDRAISYRVDRGYDHFAVSLAVGVQRMVRSDRACAGVLFTLDTESGFPDVVRIDSSWGLGESVVKGRVDPDEFVVHKPTLRAGFRSIVKRACGSKRETLVYADRGARATRIVRTKAADRARLTLTDDEVLQLARWGCEIEEHYSAREKRPVPVDVEWAKDGLTGEIHIVQARPETVHAGRKLQVETFRLETRGRVVARGKSVGRKIGAGPVRNVASASQLGSFQRGEILVAEMTDPDWEPAMKLASAIVTARGGRTCHAAIVSRELGVPCVVGVGDASPLENGDEVTVSCAEGEEGRVYEGRLPFRRETLDPGSLPRPRTRVLLNLGDPDQAFSLAALPCDGVGLAREEFVIAHLIGIHPLALTRFESLPHDEVRREIAKRTSRWRAPAEFFVETLAEGLGQIAAAFWPREVVIRLSDFKTNEYASLLGGARFEPKEENPMIGFRGASRYDDDRYREGFVLECRAVRKLREDMGFWNVSLMVPFCRTPQEGERVLEVMASEGLDRNSGLRVLVMCELPSNVILAEKFAEIFDGFSIGSNDLTQLVLGIDRDSELLAHLFDERNPAVTQLLGDVIRRAHSKGKPVGICGEAPGDYPELARFLVEAGIDSISVSPDRYIDTVRAVFAAEAAMGIPPRPHAPEL